MCGYTDIRKNAKGHYYCRVCGIDKGPEFRKTIAAVFGKQEAEKLDAQCAERSAVETKEPGCADPSGCPHAAVCGHSGGCRYQALGLVEKTKAGQDAKQLAWALAAYESGQTLISEGGGDSLHIRQTRALGILFGEVERLEKLLYPIGQSAKAPAERTPKDYAIEHAEYLAKAAEDFLTSLNDVSMADQALETWDESDPAWQEAKRKSDAAWEARHDHWKGVQNAIYEFRKRAERARGITIRERPAPRRGGDPR